MSAVYATEAGLPFVVVGDREIALGCIPTEPLFSFFPFFEERFEALPESQWQENSLKSLAPAIRNQSRYGSCAGQATVFAYSIAKKKSAPRDTFPTLSATFIYGNINGGKDQGATIGNAMKAITNVGTCLDSQVPTNVIFKQQFPKEAFNTATRFKALEAYKLRNFEELCTALSLGMPCVSGIAVGSNFTRGDIKSNGVAPLPDSIVGGHALCHTGLKKIDGRWSIETPNSWGAQWGVNGWCYLQKDHWSPGFGFPFDCFAIYSVIDDPDDEDDSPPTLK